MKHILFYILLLSIVLSSNGQTTEDSSIQNKWINTGYFEWRTQENSPEIWFEGMVALKITDLGSKQESLPDVSDGEQLNSVHKMFKGGDSLDDGTKLKKAPFFNTSNVKDFSYMFEDCFFIETIPTYETSNGVNFHGMLYNCHSLTFVPDFNTSNGTDFGWMFFKTSIRTAPILDTSKGTDFSFMFTNCIYMHSIPLIDTSRGTNFTMMFQECPFLESVSLDVSNSAHFWIMFGNCFSLKDVKLKGLGKGKPSLPDYEFIYKKNDLELPEDISIESLEYIIDNGENMHSDVFYLRVYEPLESKISQELIEKGKSKRFTFQFK